MAGDLGSPTVTKVIQYIIYLQILIVFACARNITLKEPQSLITAQIGEELRITCPGTKCRNPDFIWATLTDRPLRGVTNNFGQISVLTMKISNENLDQYDTYRCTVRCDNPPAEKGFKIIVYSLPKPILTISSLMAGEQSHITCTIPDAYPLHMITAQLLIGETIVLNTTEDESETVKNISLTHDLILTDEIQKIKCEAKLKFQEDEIKPIYQDTSMHVKLLYPPGKPNIAVFPATTVYVAENISLTCTFENRSKANVQWMKQDKENKTVILSDLQDNLTILNAKPEDSGMYICRVWNDVAERSSQVQITIQAVPDKPTLTIYPTSTVQAGDSVTIECLANGNKNVNVSLWKVLRNGETLLLEEKEKKVIKEADPIDSAVYKCIAENHYGVSEASESLTVQYPPMETYLTSSDEEVNEGGEVTLTCSSKGVPEPSFIIHHLLPSGNSVLLSEGPVVTLTNVTNGIYRCKAINSLGSKKVDLELRVRSPPKNTFLEFAPSSVVKEGDDVQIQCISEAYPSPKLVLLKKTEHGLIKKLDSEDGLYNITNAGEKNMGTYICESINAVGKQTTEATLTVKILPRNITVVTPSQNITAGVTVNITYDTHIIPPQERQQSSRFDYVPPAIIGSVVLVTAGFIGIIAYHLKQARAQGSYSLVKALRSKV